MVDGVPRECVAGPRYVLLGVVMAWPDVALDVLRVSLNHWLYEEGCPQCLPTPAWFRELTFMLCLPLMVVMSVERFIFSIS